jgi:hypothetical protein
MFNRFNLAWIPAVLLIFIVGMACSSNFNTFMTELVK